MVTTLRSKFTGVKAGKCQIKLRGLIVYHFMLVPTRTVIKITKAV